MNISKKTKYFINKANRKKAQAKRTSYRIQQYNNYLIDDYVESYTEDGNAMKPSQAQLWAGISILMKPTVYSNYQKIINSKYTSNNAFEKMLLRNKADKELNRIVESQVNRVSQNIDTIDNVLRRYELPLQEYHRMLDEQKDRSVANRYHTIEEIIRQRQDLENGKLDISTTTNYRDVSVMTEQLLMQSQSLTDYEECVAMNEEAIANGKSPIITKKKWIHTHNGATTRHQDMGQYPTIDFETTFEVTDENTGTVDEMLYPRDLQGSPENVFGCVCEINYF